MARKARYVLMASSVWSRYVGVSPSLTCSVKFIAGSSRFMLGLVSTFFKYLWHSYRSLNRRYAVSSIHQRRYLSVKLQILNAEIRQRQVCSLVSTPASAISPIGLMTGYPAINIGTGILQLLKRAGKRSATSSLKTTAACSPTKK